MSEIKIEQVSRQVIGNQILIALNDESKVAIILGKQELKDIIIGLKKTILDDTKRKIRVKVLVEDMWKLFNSAFMNLKSR